MNDDSGASGLGIPATHSLPATTAVGRVTLLVSDLDRSTQFYETMLGFHVLERAVDHVVLGEPGGAPLLELHTHDGVMPAPPETLGLYHFAVLLPDRPALGRLVGHLAERHVRLGAADHLVSEAIYLNDPDGLGIEVYADRPRTQWRARGGELAMATDPLDFESLLHSAGTSAWDQLPAGTTIGHVHLRVGDLGRAREFYHERLGLDITVSHYPGALFLSAGGYHHHLGLNTWAGPRAAPPPPAAARLLYWELVVHEQDAARAAVDRITAAGGSAVGLSATAWEVHDPWSTGLHIRTDG